MQECALPWIQNHLLLPTPPLYSLPPQLTCVSAESLRSSLQMYAARHAFTQYSTDTEMLRNSVLCHGEEAPYMSDLLRLNICSSLAYAFARLAHHVSVAAEHICRYTITTSSRFTPAESPGILFGNIIKSYVPNPVKSLPSVILSGFTTWIQLLQLPSSIHAHRQQQRVACLMLTDQGQVTCASWMLYMVIDQSSS